MDKESDDDTETSNSSIKSDNNTTTCQDDIPSPTSRPAIPRPSHLRSNNNRRFVRSTPATGLDYTHPLATETTFEDDDDKAESVVDEEYGNNDNGTMYGIPEIDHGEYLYPLDENGTTERQQGQNLTRASLSHADAKDRHEQFNLFLLNLLLW
ncbi:unnamed protein product [Absidia cylindrospora]